MPYVLRDQDGKITRVSARTKISDEFLPHNHTELFTFLIMHGQEPLTVENAYVELCASDAELTRAIEDVILLLLKKNIFKMSELPRPVQDRMALRVKLRMIIEDAYERASHKAANAPAPTANSSPATAAE